LLGDPFYYLLSPLVAQRMSAASPPRSAERLRLSGYLVNHYL
jgi:hypothetical protein